MGSARSFRKVCPVSPNPRKWDLSQTLSRIGFMNTVMFVNSTVRATHDMHKHFFRELIFPEIMITIT